MSKASKSLLSVFDSFNWFAKSADVGGGLPTGSISDVSEMSVRLFKSTYHLACLACLVVEFGSLVETSLHLLCRSWSVAMRRGVRGVPECDRGTSVCY